MWLLSPARSNADVRHLFGPSSLRVIYERTRSPNNLSAVPTELASEVLLADSSGGRSRISVPLRLEASPGLACRLPLFTCALRPVAGCLARQARERVPDSA